MHPYDLQPESRAALWKETITQLETYLTNTASLPTSPKLDKEAIQETATNFDFQVPIPPNQAIHHVIESLKAYQVHTPHPSYYGLFNPRANFPSILADLITATFNPQMAAWSHSPFAAEVEDYLVREFGKRFGYPEPEIDGVFCSGGAEANQTAILTALNHHFPGYAKDGLQGLEKQPVLYCSADAHHSVAKAARTSGLGSNAVREIAIDDQLRMIPSALEQQIKEDLGQGMVPFLVVATAGTTGPGAIDPLEEIAAICQRYALWFHADSAYGGALALHPDYRHHLKGIEKSDSITFDVHKWLSVPMGASMFITRHPDILHRTFRITAEYMPKEASEMAITDPFTHSIQWSRRFIGLKLYLPMLVFGWPGMEAMVHRQIETGEYLKRRLEDGGWTIHNPTPMPIVCFSHPKLDDPDVASIISREIVSSGKAWISVYPVGGKLRLRACVTNYATEKEHVDQLIEQLDAYIE